uniref:Uncharacterized protein n=1 Tax=Trepomonas sp. PC1 TaxID=1076344 RepID=A0A146K825_9EUKA|eukprot:JAP92767.1 Hypothetical protein TPC1_15180 [Trepomonas sp. PC1]
MKINVLLPVERLGQLRLMCDPNMSFYQFIKPHLDEHKIEVSKYYLIDEYNRQFSMSKPMNQCGFYRGICVEFKELKDRKDLEEIDTTNILQDTVDITFNFDFDKNKQPKTLKVYRSMSPQAALIQNKVYQELPDNLVCIFSDEAYPIHFSFDEMGVFSDCEVVMTFMNPDDMQAPPNEDFVTKDSTKMTKEDYLRFKYEQKRWEEEMGTGKFQTQEDREALKLARIERKGIIQFKVISTQLGKQITKFSVHAASNLEQIYVEFDLFLKEKFAQLENDQLEKLLSSYKLLQGRGGIAIDKNQLSAYDHFGGGNALLDLVIADEFREMDW